MTSASVMKGKYSWTTNIARNARLHPPPPLLSVKLSSIPTRGLAIKTPHHGTQDDFQDTICGEGLVPKLVPRIKGSCVNHVSHPVTGQAIIQVPQSLRCSLIVANLEELDAHLVQRCVESVETLGVQHNVGLRIIRGPPVGNDNQVDGLDAGKVPGARQLLDIRRENAADSFAGVGQAIGTDGPEQVVHDLRIRHIVVSVGSSVGSGSGAGRVVQEIQVDAVLVALGAYGSDGRKSRSCFFPPLACHGTRVVYQEYRVKLGEKGVAIVV